MRRTALNSVYELAQTDDRIVFIGSDLGPGVLAEMKQAMPERFFMEGVSEQHIVGMAAGLAMEGFIPYVNTIATFLTRRCYEQVALDLCLQDLPVRLIANGGGVVYAPLGPTHLAVEDISLFRSLPNMTILSPCDAQEMGHLMQQTVDWSHPIYIRLAKGGDKIVSRADSKPEIGKAELLREPGNGLFVTTGVMAQLALEAAEQLEKDGIGCGVLHLHTVKPLDGESLSQWLPQARHIITVEEHTLIGGLGSALLEFCSDHLPAQTSKIRRVGIPDHFADRYGSQTSLWMHWGITVETLYQQMHRAITG
ncbi:MAG: transketolase [Spirulina sp. SIO3F2]|nr:transketolase [Spirulina sp. SIO3F2]